MRWIKSSEENIPKEWGMVHWRDIKTKQPLSAGFVYGVFTRKKFDTIEWLDESASAGEDAVEFAEWIETKGYWYDHEEKLWFISYVVPDSFTTQQLYNLFREQTGKPTIDSLRVSQNADYKKLKEENERLKGLLKKVHEAGVESIFLSTGFGIERAKKESTESWEKFKTENNL